jgi:hypothetical protein
MWRQEDPEFVVSRDYSLPRQPRVHNETLSLNKQPMQDRSRKFYRKGNIHRPKDL